MSEIKVSAKFASDPLTDLPQGAQLKFKCCEFGNSNATPIVDGVTNWSFFNGAVMGVILKSENSTDLTGTAFVVAPGLAITAAHVFNINLLECGRLSACCLGIRDKSLDIWRVSDVCVAPDDDIALLSISLSSEIPKCNTFYKIPRTTRTPIIDEILHIVGFRNVDFCYDTQGGFQFSGNLHCAAGAVTAVYPEGRDRKLMPYPAIEIDCGSLGGMSGGVVIDRYGLALGVISTGLDTQDGRGPTYGAWIIKALGRRFDHRWPPGLAGTRVDMLSLDERLLYIDRRDALTRISDERLEYRSWFG